MENDLRSPDQVFYFIMDIAELIIRIQRAATYTIPIMYFFKDNALKQKIISEQHEILNLLLETIKERSKDEWIDFIKIPQDYIQADKNRLECIVRGNDLWGISNDLIEATEKWNEILNEALEHIAGILAEDAH